jgi:hypothetical protein
VVLRVGDQLAGCPLDVLGQHGDGGFGVLNDGERPAILGLTATTLLPRLARLRSYESSAT